MVKLYLARMLYGHSFRDLVVMYGSDASTLQRCLAWVKYKCEFFWQNYLTSFDYRTRYFFSLHTEVLRLQIAQECNSRENWYITFLLDGTHIPIDIKSRDRQFAKSEYVSSKPKTSTCGMYCLNFVVLILPNGMAADVLYPLPSKRADSQVVRSGESPSGKKNYDQINENFGRRDTGIGDANFSCYRTNRSDQALLASTILTRPTKARGERFLPIQKALADRLSDTRNQIELNFGYHKARFESQSGKKGRSRIPGNIRWAHSEVANSFALENIHCFPTLLDIRDAEDDHPFFETNPEVDVDEPDDIYIDPMLDGEVPEDVMGLLEIQAERERFLFFFVFFK